MDRTPQTEIAEVLGLDGELESGVDAMLARLGVPTGPRRAARAETRTSQS
jgi:hypothetical protein